MEQRATDGVLSALDEYAESVKVHAASAACLPSGFSRQPFIAWQTGHLVSIAADTGAAEHAPLLALPLPWRACLCLARVLAHPPAVLIFDPGLKTDASMHESIH